MKDSEPARDGPSQERLSLLDALLATLVFETPESRCRSAAVAIARDAAASNDLESLVSEPIERLVTGGSAGVDSLRLLQSQLDEGYWDEQDRLDQGLSTPEQVANMFRKARAAASLFAATSSDARNACCEATYEAYHVSPDGDHVLNKMRRLLSDASTQNN